MLEKGTGPSAPTKKISSKTYIKFLIDFNQKIKKILTKKIKNRVPANFFRGVTPSKRTRVEQKITSMNYYSETFFEIF